MRGNFGDPRTLRGSIDAHGNNPLSFHSGIDIQASDGTPVYAIEPGEVRRTSATAIAVGTPWATASAPLVFGYWHIDPVVVDLQYVGFHQLIGYVHPGAGHVHLSERRFGRYVNPLRSGGITPYSDFQRPVIRSITVYRASTQREMQQDAVSGRVDIVVDAYDPPSIPLWSPWSGAVLSPEHVSWGGLFGGTWIPTSFHPLTVDFTGLPSLPVPDVYAPGTRQNGPNAPGDYRFWLVRNLDTGVLSPGPHTIWATASDTRGNSATLTFRFTVVDVPAPADGPALARLREAQVDLGRGWIRPA